MDIFILTEMLKRTLLFIVKCVFQYNFHFLKYVLFIYLFIVFRFNRVATVSQNLSLALLYSCSIFSKVFSERLFFHSTNSTNCKEPYTIFYI